MLPYPREYPKAPSKEQIYNVASTRTPVVFPSLTNPTDSFLNGVTTDRAGEDVDQWYRYAAFSERELPVYRELFGQGSLDWISNQITRRLKGVHPEGKNILVPDESILSVLDTYWNHATLYDPELIMQQTVTFIVETIKNDFQNERQNASLSIWNSIFTPDLGMRQHGPIKLNERKRNAYWSWNY
jgi:hypothetical protein